MQAQDYFPNTMNSRTHTRHNLSMKVALYCKIKNCHLQGQVRDISTGGMFIMAPAPRAQTGWRFDISMHFPSWKNEQHINATVNRVTSHGFALQFLLDTVTQQMLEDVLLPNWDGNNVYEGMVLFAEREHIVDFSEWLRLTSLVCNQYRQCARARALTQGMKTHQI